MALQKFVRTLSRPDWYGTTAGTVTAQPAVWNTVASYTVPAQQQVTFGANDPVGGGSIAGRNVYLIFEDQAGTQLQGTVRFALTNATQTNTVVVMEERTEKLSANQNDRTLAPLLPEYPSRAKEDSLLLIQFYPDSATAVTLRHSSTLSQLLIPVTVYQ